MGILGVALTKILINDSRFVSRQDAMLGSRQAARAALNTVISELSLVGDSAVTAASRDSITIRVPYGFGITCRSPTGNTKVATIMPVDSLAWATSITPGGFWRKKSGVYTRLTGSATFAI